jgi:mRNA interferase MazF
MIKRFLEWIGLKEKLNNNDHKPPLFKEGEIWWCAIGENVGVEVNGKGKQFSRPVYIYKKLSANGFLGIPLSTALKVGTWYSEITFQERKILANLAQCRVFSYLRMYEKMGTLDETDILKIKNEFLRLYS